MMIITVANKKTVQIIPPMALPVLITGFAKPALLAVSKSKKLKPFSEIIPGESRLDLHTLKLICLLIAPSRMG